MDSDDSPLFAEWLGLLGAFGPFKNPAPLGEDDALLVIDMQADFVPLDAKANPMGGKFGVAEGDKIVDPIVKLINAAVRAGATVCATRDYHPHDHVSFNTHGGPFPVHCVQGSAGSKFLAPIASALSDGVRELGSDRVFVAFKAMHECIDSFGALPYETGGEGRIARAPTGLPRCSPCGCTAAPWTGSLVLKQSALEMPAEAGGPASIDMDAPPDVLAVLEDGFDRQMKSLQQALKGKKRLFVCGLALDFCVLDTCLNARDLGFEAVHMVLDAARAAHLPGIGSHGSGFLAHPKDVVAKMQAAQVGVVSTASLLGRRRTSFTKLVPPSAAAPAPSPEVKAAPGFPDALGPLGLSSADVAVQLRRGGRVYEVELSGALGQLSQLGITNVGTSSPAAPLPRGWPGAPPSAVALCWANPIQGVARLSAEKESSKAQLAFLSLSTSAELCFAAYGGFLLLDRNGGVVSVQAVGNGATLRFGEPRRWPPNFTSALEATGRMQPVTLPALQRAGAEAFCWISPGEALVSSKTREKWVVSQTGAFAYRRSGGQPTLYFELEPQPKEHVAYATDFEGNWEYFRAYVERSEALTLKGMHADGSADIELADGWRFVHGGDSCDKGGAVGGTVRVVRSLVRLKARYGPRVVLLLGNRDLNKMRITSELHPSQLDPRRLRSVPGPYWVPEAKRVSPLQYLTKALGGKEGEPPPTDADIERADTPWSRLRWMLKDTMGADGEEERRRKELEELMGGGPVDDSAVYRSFTDSVKPGGFMRQYIELGQLAALIDGTLYVHGGVVGAGWAGGATDCIGYVPGRRALIEDIGSWVGALNAWKGEQVAQWASQPEWARAPLLADVRDGVRGGHWLMDYCVDGSPPSVVCGRHLSKTGMPEPLPAPLCAKLLRGGVHRLVLGHTPHGNCPTVIQSGCAPLTIVMVDTSYSDMKAADNRGTAISTVDILNDGSVRVDGVLPESVQGGARIKYTLAPMVGRADGSELIGLIEPETQPDGKPTEGRRFVKSRLTTGELLMCHVAGFKVEYSTATDAEVRALLGIGDGSAPVRHQKSEELSATGDEACIGRGEDFAQARREVLTKLFVDMDVDSDGRLTVTELETALSRDPSILKLIAGTGNTPPSAASLLATLRGAAGGVELDEFIDVVEGRTPSTRASNRSSANRSMEGGQRPATAHQPRRSMESATRKAPEAAPVESKPRPRSSLPTRLSYDQAVEWNRRIDDELELCRKELHTLMLERRNKQPKQAW